MFYYEYEVTFFNECSKTTQIGRGTTAAANLKDALENIIQFYGEDEILHIDYLGYCSDNTVYEFNREDNHYKLALKGVNI